MTSTSTDGTTSTSPDGTTSTSTNGTTSTSIDGTTSTSTDATTLTSINGTTSTSTNDLTSTSIDGTNSETIDNTLVAIDTEFCHRSIPLEIPERSSCPQDIADSTLRSIDISSCDPTSDGDREITMEDFLELEEFLELEDGEKLEDLDSSREVTMEDFLELEEWLEDMDHNSKKKLDDDQHTSIDLHPHSIIDRHPPDCIDRHPWLDELPGYIVELEQVEERMYMSKASHLAVPKHQRLAIWTEEAAGFHKRVKRIHDPVKIVVPCDVFEAESPIPLDKSPTESVSNDINKPGSIDTTISTSIDSITSTSIDTGPYQSKRSSMRVEIFLMEAHHAIR
ncbi:hypothetical protein DY000_02021706 [Brassica cretica]|uniref:Uncharacterized protein n=1 Tax=Brassica cretica TaxID=69181 RepID=A0ABQ7EL05_BRACR|nr:hypothetical protein DY000_02021706 [Brassica cretica]